MPQTTIDIAHALAVINSTSTTSRDRDQQIQSLLKITRQLWYRWSIRLKTRAIAFDLDDAKQEAAIAIIEAAKCYDPSQYALPFVYLVMIRRFASLMIRACRPCRDQPKSMIYADHVHVDDLDRPLMHYLPNKRKLLHDPEILDEYEVTMTVLADLLSAKQLETFRRRFEQGQTYPEIAAETGRNLKSVDNSIQRCREKLDELHAEDAQQLLRWSRRYRSTG